MRCFFSAAHCHPMLFSRVSKSSFSLNNLYPNLPQTTTCVWCTEWLAAKLEQAAHPATNTCAPLSGKSHHLGQIQYSVIFKHNKREIWDLQYYTNHLVNTKRVTGFVNDDNYVSPVIATRCLWICLTWPPSWFRESGYQSWTRLSTVFCTLPSAVTVLTAAVMTRTRQSWRDQSHHGIVGNVSWRPMGTYGDMGLSLACHFQSKKTRIYHSFVFKYITSL